MAARSLGAGSGLEAAGLAIRTAMTKLGGGLLEKLLAADPGYRGPRVDCGAGHQAAFVSYRAKTIDTVPGPVRVDRAWYHCHQCRHGLAPRDAELGTARASMSPGLAKMTAQAATAVPFAQAAGLLAELAGIGLTTKRVERSAEATGTAAAKAARTQADAIRSRQVVPLPPPAPPPDMLYIAVDGTGVPMTAAETQGRPGKGEDGKARTREVKLACLFTQATTDDDGHPVRGRGSSTYLATFEPAARFGQLVDAEARRRGSEHIRQLVVPGDGAVWIWNLADELFPAATQIVDLSAPRGALLYPPRSGEGMEVICVPGPDGLPGPERGKGTIACQETRGRAQAYGTVRWGARVIWRNLDWLNPNLQKAQNDARRKDA